MSHEQEVGQIVNTIFFKRKMGLIIEIRNIAQIHN